MNVQLRGTLGPVLPVLRHLGRFAAIWLALAVTQAAWTMTWALATAASPLVTGVGLFKYMFLLSAPAALVVTTGIGLIEWRRSP